MNEFTHYFWILSSRKKEEISNFYAHYNYDFGGLEWIFWFDVSQPNPTVRTLHDQKNPIYIYFEFSIWYSVCGGGGGGGLLKIDTISLS